MALIAKCVAFLCNRYHYGACIRTEVQVQYTEYNNHFVTYNKNLFPSFLFSKYQQHGLCFAASALGIPQLFRLDLSGFRSGIYVAQTRWVQLYCSTFGGMETTNSPGTRFSRYRKYSDKVSLFWAFKVHLFHAKSLK